MLGKRPCLLRSTRSRSLLIPCEDTLEGSMILCTDANVTEKSPHAALSTPCKVVIGFDIGCEKKLFPDACESPRSVLDTLALLPSQEKQHVVARSPRSALGSLLTSKSGSGAGLEIVAQIQDKEAGVHVGSVAGSRKPTFDSQTCLNETYPKRMSLSLKASHVHLKDIGLLCEGSNLDFMDHDIPFWQRRALSVLCVEDECLDADISPRRSQALCASTAENLNAKVADSDCSQNRSRALNGCIENGVQAVFLDADSLPQCSQAPRQTECSHFIAKNFMNNDQSILQLSTCESEVPYGHGMGAAVNVWKADHSSTQKSDAWSVHEDECADTHISQWQKHALCQLNIDMESEEISIQQSIFSATSPPSCPHSLTTSFSGFLKECAFCGHSLRLGKDIFMYRGDQAFCSAECRYQKILLDEQKGNQDS